jgi:hypothetical protein
MRIKWTAIPSVVSGLSAVPWVTPGPAERLTKEATKGREPKKKDKKKTDRALDWLRRSG